MDEFELAGFDEETCEQLRKISRESGIDPDCIIHFVRYQDEQTMLSAVEQLNSAWYIFARKVWDEFGKSRIGKLMIWLADRLKAWLERFRK